MALVENKKSETMQEHQEKDDEVYYRVYPDMNRRIDHDERKVRLEISLPGVKKEHITLKVLPTWFHLTGRRGHMEYSANQSFGVEIVPEKTIAQYDNGLLKVEAIMKNPLDNAKKIEF